VLSENDIRDIWYGVLRRRKPISALDIEFALAIVALVLRGKVHSRLGDFK